MNEFRARFISLILLNLNDSVTNSTRFINKQDDSLSSSTYLVHIILMCNALYSSSFSSCISLFFICRNKGYFLKGLFTIWGDITLLHTSIRHQVRSLTTLPLCAGGFAARNTNVAPMRITRRVFCFFFLFASIHRGA